ncbi:MAG: fibronectin type III domain-containing protein, partial [Desulfobacterales bacterium]|nr:fibronectin type III domain-containing protein [Desulfobacterales bacterium]
SGLDPNTTYAFRARAHRGYWTNSDYSNCASVKTAASGTPPSPTNLKATATSSSQIKLTWKDNATNESGFEIYRKAGAKKWEWLITTEPNVKTFIDDTAENNPSTILYQYYILAFNDSGNSPSTFSATVQYSPINLKASPGTDVGAIKLTWADKSSNETGFEIYRKTGKCESAAKWTKVATLAANQKTWTDKWRTSGKEYAYQIRAFRKTGLALPAYGYSIYSNCSSVKAP